MANHKIFTVNNAGVVTAGSLENGDRLWQLRIQGPFSGSPVGWGPYLYFINEKGLVQVVDTNAEEGAIVSQVNVEETNSMENQINDNRACMRHEMHVPTPIVHVRH